MYRHKGEKLDNYFARLVEEGVQLHELHQGISKAKIEALLNQIGIQSADVVDLIFAMLDDTFPSTFLSVSKDPQPALFGEFSDSDGKKIREWI